MIDGAAVVVVIVGSVVHDATRRAVHSVHLPASARPHGRRRRSAIHYAFHAVTGCASHIGTLSAFNSYDCLIAQCSIIVIMIGRVIYWRPVAHAVRPVVAGAVAVVVVFYCENMRCTTTGQRTRPNALLVA